MAPGVTAKPLARFFPKSWSRKSASSTDFGHASMPQAVEHLTKELTQEFGRVPPEARADLVITQAHLTRLSVPDEDSDQTVLLWLAKRGFHDVLALRADQGLELKSRKREGLDLCLWVHPERLLRAAIEKDPAREPLHPRELSSEERASLVQAATAVLSEAKAKKVLSYGRMFLLHDPATLSKIMRLQNSCQIIWDRGDVLLDAIAAYFGTKVAFYFAWLQFYTAALVFPTMVGILVWWRERVHTDVEYDGEPGRSGLTDKSNDSYFFNGWEWISSIRRPTAGSNASLWSTSWQPYFNCFLAIWATLLLVMWKRRSSTLAFRWRVHKEETLERAKSMWGWKRQGSSRGSNASRLLGSSSSSIRSTTSTSTTISTSTGSIKNNGKSTRSFNCSTANKDHNNTNPRATVAAANMNAATSGPPISISTSASCHYCPVTRFRAAAAQRATATANQVGRRGRWEGLGATWRSIASSTFFMVGGGKSRRANGEGAELRAAELRAAEKTARGGEWGLEGVAWERLRIARFFASWALEAVLLYLAIRIMLWFAWLELRSKQQFGDYSINITLVRAASVLFPRTFYGIHGKWALAMTKWEGHVTDASFENSMIVKQFTFRSVNSFSRLFYMGFWQRDLVGLNQMLMTVLLSRSATDAIQEVVAPMIQVHLRRSLRRKVAARKASEGGYLDMDSVSLREPNNYLLSIHNNSTRRSGGRRSAQCQEVACRALEKASREKKQMYREVMNNERTLPEYDATSEFLDLMIQYGHVTMFAVAFPLAPLLALLRCLVEIYIDHQKLVRSRRPSHVDRSGIGAWYGILEFVGMASVLTNCLLLALTAEKLRLYIPSALVHQFPHSKYLVMAVFCEHMILGMKFFVGVMIDDVPDGVERLVAHELLSSHEESRRNLENALGFQEDVAATKVQIVRDPVQRLHRSNSGISNISHSVLNGHQARSLHASGSKRGPSSSSSFSVSLNNTPAMGSASRSGSLNQQEQQQYGYSRGSSTTVSLSSQPSSRQTSFSPSAETRSAKQQPDRVRATQLLRQTHGGNSYGNHHDATTISMANVEHENHLQQQKQQQQQTQVANLASVSEQPTPTTARSLHSSTLHANSNNKNKESTAELLRRRSTATATIDSSRTAAAGATATPLGGDTNAAAENVPHKMRRGWWLLRQSPLPLVSIAPVSDHAESSTPHKPSRNNDDDDDDDDDISGDDGGSHLQDGTRSEMELRDGMPNRSWVSPASGSVDGRNKEERGDGAAMRSVFSDSANARGGAYRRRRRSGLWWEKI